MGLVRGGRGGGAQVQNPKDPVAQKERAHEKERERPASRPAEERQPTLLPASTRHCALILPSIPPDEQPNIGPPAHLGLRLLLVAPLTRMLKGESP